jgi:hypothetical protein
MCEGALKMTYDAPDWRKKENYPSIKNTSPSQWAWEFLRRNNEYAADWQRYASLAKQMADPHPETADYMRWFLTQDKASHEIFRANFATDEAFRQYRSESAKKIFNFNNDAFLEYDPPAKEGESKAQHQNRVFDSGEKLMVTPLINALGEKWGIHRIRPPTADTVGSGGISFVLKLGVGASYPTIDFRHQIENAKNNPDPPHGDEGQTAIKWLNFLGETLGRPECVVVKFDLTMPIKQQINGVLEQLLFLQQDGHEAGKFCAIKQQRYQNDHYQNYLRAYDANQMGISAAEVAKILIPNEPDVYPSYAARTKVNAWIKRAKELVETDYRFIPVAANKAASQKKL